MIFFISQSQPRGHKGQLMNASGPRLNPTKPCTGLGAYTVAYVLIHTPEKLSWLYEFLGMQNNYHFHVYEFLGASCESSC